MKPAFIVIDIESTGLDPVRDSLYCIAVAYPDETTECFSGENLSPRFTDLLEDPEVAKVGHRIRFDAKFLIQRGYDVAGTWYDTKILAHLLDENDETGLKYLAEKHLGATLDGLRELEGAVKEIGGKHVGDLCRYDLERGGYDHFDVISTYAQEDVLNTLHLFLWQKEKLKRLGGQVKATFEVNRTPSDYYMSEIEPTEKLLAKMELEGVRVERAVLEDYGTQLRGEQAAVLGKLNDLASRATGALEETLLLEAQAKRKSEKGKAAVLPRSEKYGTAFNWDSNTHLGRLLYDVLELPATRTAKGNYNTSEQVLLELARNTEGKAKQLLELFLEYRGYNKLISTYAEGLAAHIQPDGRIRAEYGPFTVTGRFTSSNPNMQNLPRGCPAKRAFVPAPGRRFGYMDYSQVELRIAAHLSQDEAMLEAFTLNLDPHAITAAKVFGVEESAVTKEQRQVGKTISFLLIYDGGPMRLGEELKKVTGKEYAFDELLAFKKAYFAGYKGYKAYLDRQLKQINELNVVVSEEGRVRRLPDAVFGRWIDRYGRRFTGPRELEDRLYQPGEPRTPSETFERASKAYAHAKKQGYNFPVQSLGASITKAALIALDQAGFKVVTTVHDSIVVEVDEAKAEEQLAQAVKIAESAYTLSVPLKVDAKLLNSLAEDDVCQPDAKKFVA